MSQAPTLSPIGEVVEFFASSPSREQIAAFRLSDGALDRLRELLSRNASGELSSDEGRELDQMVLLDDILSLIRVKAQGASAA